MKSESYPDSEDESNLVIVTSSQPVNTSKQDTDGDFQNNLYSDDIIENLWKARAMGCDGPEEMLLSLWYFVSHYFGIRSRTDHAKLSLGNVIIERENGLKKIIFNREVSSSGKDVTVFTTRFSPRTIPEMVDNRDRCPVTIFEKYVLRRPSNFNYATSPLYLQPDKSVPHDGDGPWYAAAGLGKNRIGSLFNAALSRCGQPTVRHYSSRRQIISDPINKSQTTPESSQSVVDNSPKIKLKICHLSSGNPIVTRTVSDSSGLELIKPKLRSATNKKIGTRKRSVEDNGEVKEEPTVNETSSKSSQNQEQLPDDVKTDKFDCPITRYMVKPTKRTWSLQKSIVNITCKESNPISRQIMMQLSMNKDFLTPSDNKVSIGNCTKARLLRRSIKLSHLKLPMWPNIEKFCDSELQRSMTYSFDNDNSHTEDSE